MAQGVIIPISVVLKDSLTNLNKTKDGLAGVNAEATKTLKTLSQAPSGAGFDAIAKGGESVKAQLSAANAELQKVILEFGKTSTQAQDAASKVSELKSVIQDAGKAVDAADFGGRFNLIGKSIGTIASAFQTATALQAVFGGESKKTEEALKKVQAVMALTQGIQGVVEGSKALVALGAAGARAFVSLVTGIIAATGATAALATAIAATGIGLLLVGIGLAIDAIIKYFNSASTAQKAIDGLTESEKKAANAIELTNKKIAEREELLAFTSQLAVLEARIAGKNQQDLAQIEEAGRRIRIGKANEDLANAEKEKERILNDAAKKLEQARKDGDKKEIKEAKEKYNKIFEDQNKFIEERRKAVTKAEQEDALAIAQNRADAADKEREEQKKRLEDQLKKQKEFAQKRADAIRLNEELRAATTSALEQKIFNINRDFEDKKKKLIEGGITDFTALNAARAKSILDVETQANNERLQAQRNLDKAFENVIVSGLQRFIDIRKKSSELSTRAALSGIKNEYDKRDEEIKNAEKAEIDALDKSYGDKKAKTEQYFIDLANIRKFYQSETDKNNADRNKKEEEDLKAKLDSQKQILASGIADAASAFGEALAEGTDPFQAVFKSLANSLGSYLQQLGKDAILASKLIQGLKTAIGTPKGIIAGIALVALGALLKAAFNKKAEKGFKTGGFVDGPGNETSDSIPARLSKGEFVVRAKVVRRYGKQFFERINNNLIPPPQARNTPEAEFLENIISRGRKGGSAKVLVNRFEAPLLFANGGYVDGGLAEAVRQFGRKGGTTKALVNRFEIPNLGQMSNPAMPRMAPSTEPQIIATTKVSGQDLKIILERADKRYSSVT